jgi:hypothetical protein
LPERGVQCPPIGAQLKLKLFGFDNQSINANGSAFEHAASHWIRHSRA